MGARAERLPMPIAGNPGAGLDDDIFLEIGPGFRPAASSRWIGNGDRPSGPALRASIRMVAGGRPMMTSSVSIVIDARPSGHRRWKCGMPCS